MPARVNLSLGARYGRLTSIGELDGVRRSLVCKCDCGGGTIVLMSHVRTGKIKSCGCLSRETTGALSRTHGQSRNRTPTYNTWRSMLDRCASKDPKVSRSYADRGFKVCAEWRDYERFLADMGERPAGMTLDRIDNDRGYEPGNCRWADWFTQARNRRPARRRI